MSITIKNRQDEHANALVEALSSRGAILTKADARIIRQAFERHFREVQKATIAATAGLLESDTWNRIVD